MSEKVERAIIGCLSLIIMIGIVIGGFYFFF